LPYSQNASQKQSKITTQECSLVEANDRLGIDANNEQTVAVAGEQLREQAHEHSPDHLVEPDGLDVAAGHVVDVGGEEEGGVGVLAAAAAAVAEGKGRARRVGRHELRLRTRVQLGHKEGAAAAAAQATHCILSSIQRLHWYMLLLLAVAKIASRNFYIFQNFYVFTCMTLRDMIILI